MQTTINYKQSRTAGFVSFSKYLLGIFIIVTLSSCSASRTVNNSHKTNRPAKYNQLQKEYALKLNVDENQLNQLALYAYIDEWMGVKHKMGGNTKSGIDCSAFVGNIYREIYNINLPRTSADMANTIKTTSQQKLKEGDLVFFSFGKKRVDHVGIYLHNDFFVHVSSSKGVIISKLSSPWYNKYLVKQGYVK